MQAAAVAAKEKMKKKTKRNNATQKKEGGGLEATGSGEVGNGGAASPKKKKKKKKKNATAKKEEGGGVGGGEGGAATKPAPAPATPATPKLGAGAFSDSNKAERDAAKRAATTQFGDEVVSEIVGRTGEMHGSTFSEGSVQGWRASQEDAYIADVRFLFCVFFFSLISHILLHSI